MPWLVMVVTGVEANVTSPLVDRCALHEAEFPSWFALQDRSIWPAVAFVGVSRVCAVGAPMPPRASPHRLIAQRRRIGYSPLLTFGCAQMHGVRARTHGVRAPWLRCVGAL